ncbi:MAG: alpha-L-arabinofuranosidase C-terminal domain-containing protein [Fimbriimonas sp.]|nr:alpha-L-arabinofuranosidase C-terminal domain-containing protein [Fimbriimonas sp.]
MTTTIHLHTRFQVGPVDPRVFGGFLEHLGRAVYQGVYQPGSKHADSKGWRTDVIEALDRLQFTAMRYPGGNFVSGYHWMDGVGPRNERPTVRDLAWSSLEINEVGTNEFMDLSRKLNWTPMLAVNLGTGTPEEARNWVEYCNIPCGSKYADLRIGHGFEHPHQVKLWCLGNEMDGPWQIGHVPADAYAIRAQQAARMMKMTDPDLELVVCGSCAPDLPTYLHWDRTVLEHVRDDVDYISLHRYVGNEKDDTPDFLAVTKSIDEQIEETAALCRFVQRARKTRKRINLSFDEWNVWYRARSGDDVDGRGKLAPHLLEEHYNLEDAVVVMGFLNSFVRHADVVKIANLAQIVNVIAPILTRGDEMLIQSIFYPIEMMTKRRTGTSLQVAVEGPTYESKSYGKTQFIDSSAIMNGNTISVFAANRDIEKVTTVRIKVADVAIESLIDAEILVGQGPKDANTFEAPNRVQSQPFDKVCIKNGVAEFEMPPLSMFAGTFQI